MKILVSDPLADDAMKGLEDIGEVVKGFDLEKDQYNETLAESEILIVRSKTTADKALIDIGKNLKIICRAGVGLDNIDLDYAKEKNINVINTPQAPTISVAELTIGLMLSLLRKIPQGDAGIRKGDWLKKELKGSELSGKTVGIIGFGRIGSKVAKFLNAFDDTKILACDDSVEEKYLKEVGAQRVDLDTLLKESDIITIHAPLTETTEKMLDTSAFEKMKDGVFIVNTARGKIIAEEALCTALTSGEVAGIALDVYWEKQPFNCKIMDVQDKVIFSPHLGSSTKEGQARVGDLVVQNIKEALNE